MNTLRRELTLLHAVGIGLASMIGAGVFVVFAPAAAAAGSYLFVGIALALVVAICNATSTAQLAAQYPASGGTYHFGRQQLGPWPGFIAGWGFVVGKTASAGAMALTIGTYVASLVFGADALLQRVVAIVAIVLVVALNLAGITRTATASLYIVGLVLFGLAVILVAIWSDAPVAEHALSVTTQPDAFGVLQSAGLVFFAFAGYARIATLGDEVKDPQRTIPRAIAITLPIVAVLYVVLAWSLVHTLGIERLAQEAAPIQAAVGELPWAAWLVSAVAAIAAFGALLAGVAGITRTGYAMASNYDLPHPLAVLSERSAVPARLTVLVGAIAIVLVSVGDIREVIGFSSVGVLVYYFVANVAAFTQERSARQFPRWLQLLGAGLCALLVVTLPALSVLAGLAVFGIGIVYRLVAQARLAKRQ